MSRSARSARLLADFIDNNKIDCEIFNPDNLRFATLDEERSLPTLYFEDNSGCKGRIRQNHELGPLLYFSNDDIRLFFTEDVDYETKREITLRKKNQPHFGPPKPELTNFIVEIAEDLETGTLVETITPILIEDLELYPDHSALYEFNPTTRTTHLSGGCLKKIKDIRDDFLTKEVLQLRSERSRGDAVITAAINSFYFNEFDTAHVRSGDTSESLHIELQEIAPEELSSAINDAAKACEAAAPSTVPSLKKSPYVEGEEVKKIYTAESAATTLKPTNTKKRKF